VTLGANHSAEATTADRHQKPGQAQTEAALFFLGQSGLTRAGIQRHIKLDGYAFRRVGGQGNASLKLSEQALDHLEAQARPWLVDIEVLRKTDSLIRHLHMQVGAAHFARYLYFSGSFGIRMLSGIRHNLVDQKAQRNCFVSGNHQMTEGAGYLIDNGFLQLPAKFAREVGDIDKPDPGAAP